MFQERIVQTGEVALNLAVGPENGPPLLFLHGVTRRWQDFLPIVTPFTARWQVMALDHRGHGRSGRAAGYAVTDYLHDAVAFARNYLSKPAVIWGHSLGAMVAAGIAAGLPGKVKAVVLEDPPFETLGRAIGGTPFWELFLGMRTVCTESHESVSAMARSLAQIRFHSPDRSNVLALGSVRDEAQLRFGARCLIDLDPAVFDPLLGGHWLDGFDWEAMLPKVTCPAMLLAADWNAGGMMPGESSLKVSWSVPGCTRIDFPGVGHQIHWQQPEAVVRAGMAFLESL